MNKKSNISVMSMIMVLILTLVFSGCGGKKADSGNASSSSGKKAGTKAVAGLVLDAVQLRKNVIGELNKVLEK
jgi:hypothetical protein